MPEGGKRIFGLNMRKSCFKKKKPESTNPKGKFTKIIPYVNNFVSFT